jgi:beta-lactamase class A
MKKTTTAVFIGFIFGAITFYFASNFIVRRNFEQAPDTAKYAERRSGQNQLVNPLLDCPDFAKAMPPKQNKLEQALERKIKQLQEVGSITEAGIYFKDLNNGPDFGINEDLTFSPASLLKVPLMIGYFKIAEKNPQILNDTLIYVPDKEEEKFAKQNFYPQNQLETNKRYTVSELIDQLIIESDNKVTGVLLEHIDLDVVQLLNNMGVKLNLEIKDGKLLGSNLTVESYASIFRILYNATFLNPEYSNKAMQILAAAKMTDGLKAGVAPEIIVAHKFGERFDGDTKQFHDCGIIYYPKRPYLLCVMTRGKKSFADLVAAVEGISKTVYDEVTNN